MMTMTLHRRALRDFGKMLLKGVILLSQVVSSQRDRAFLTLPNKQMI